MKKVAVVLSGCGYLDGSEIREAVATLWALDHHVNKFSVQCFAPEKPQTDVVDHLSGQPAGSESRDMLSEAARIARGKILPLAQLNPAEFHALILPGGYGVAKNLSDFASKGAEGSVLPELKTVLEKMHADRKPIGAICIAPAVVALAFKGKGFELTVGQPGETSQEIEKLGHKHFVCATNGVHVDTSARVITTPAYMKDSASIKEVFTGIQKLVNETLSLA